MNIEERTVSILNTLKATFVQNATRNNSTANTFILHVAYRQKVAHSDAI